MELNDVEWKQIIDNDKLVVIDFSAEAWCNPCRIISPIIDKLSEKYIDKVIIGKINIDNNTVLATKYSVRGIPTVLFIKNGEVVDKIVGAGTESAYEQKIENLINS
jgi:thioredoxin 1